MTLRDFIYNQLKGSPEVLAFLGDEPNGRIFPRYSQTNFNLLKPFLMYGIGNQSPEGLSEDDDGLRQFFEVQIHDEGGDFSRIDDEGIPAVKAALLNQTDGGDIITIRGLEVSGEFNNETYNTKFRYVRLQAIIRERTTTP